MLELFTNTDAFFEKKINEKQEFKTPIIIIGLVWLAGVFSLALIFSGFISEFPSDILYPILMVAAIALAIGLVGNYFMWVLCSSIFYMISIVFQGKGNFNRVLEFSSYGFIPYIISTVVSSIYMWRLFLDIDMFSMSGTIGANDDPSIFFNQLIFSNIAGTVFIVIFSLAMFGLSAYIWTYGMKYSRNLSLKKALLTVGIPLAVYVIYETFLFLFFII
ncbi:Yip1 family protein [Methanolobus sp. ZRKC2]|uniref:Yip1 family protein n=1 Tax=Methanolobus sp. ZRKC2 TaxID=3125783 RepID=UPI003254D466